MFLVMSSLMTLAEYKYREVLPPMIKPGPIVVAEQTSLHKHCPLSPTTSPLGYKDSTMSALGKVVIGEKAPDFHCEAVIAGKVQGISLISHMPSLFTYIC